MATIDIVIPSYKGLRPAAWTTIVQAMRYSECQCHDKHGIRLHPPWECPRQHSLYLLPHQQSCIIHWARNASVAYALYGPHPEGRPPADWFFFLDDDILIEPHYIQRLLSHKKDIVAGICTVRRDPPKPTIRFWREDLKAFVEPVEWDWGSEKLMEIDAAGAACMLVNRRVLEAMAEAHLDCHFEREEDRRKFPGVDVDAYWNQKSRYRKERFESAAEAGEWQKMDCFWFQLLSNVVDEQTSELGEDLSFCWKAKKLGYRIYADPQVLPGHLGEYSYSIRDWIFFTEEAKAQGELKGLPENEAGLSVKHTVEEETEKELA